MWHGDITSRILNNPDHPYEYAKSRPVLNGGFAIDIQPRPTEQPTQIAAPSLHQQTGIVPRATAICRLLLPLVSVLQRLRIVCNRMAMLVVEEDLIHLAIAVSRH